LGEDVLAVLEVLDILALREVGVMGLDGLHDPLVPGGGRQQPFEVAAQKDRENEREMVALDLRRLDDQRVAGDLCESTGASDQSPAAVRARRVDRPFGDIYHEATRMGHNVVLRPRVRRQCWR
jgi:hypothetical protein